MLHLGGEKSIGHPGRSVFQREIGGAAFPKRAQDLFRNLQHHQCVGEQVCRRNGTHGYGRGKACGFIAEAGAGDVGTGV